MTRSRKRKAAEMAEDEEAGRNGSLMRFGGAKDLKITVGSSRKKRVVWYHSVSMASHSNYIDAMLSTPMKESGTKELSFPDISVSQWEAMMNFLTNPSASRHMKVQDAIELVRLYDKYDFRSGVDLCDDVLADLIDDVDESPDASDNTDEKIEVIALGIELGLSYTLERGKCWFRTCIGDIPALKMQFTVEHIQKLQPMIVGDSDISNDLQDMLGQEVDVENSMFPAFFVSQFQLIAARNTVSKLVNVIEVSECEAAGTFDNTGDGTIDSSLTYNHRDRKYGRVGEIDGYEIAKQEGKSWKIYKRVVEPGQGIYTLRTEALYECKGSRYATLPPRNGWKTQVRESMGGGLYSLKTVEPKLKYFHKSLDGELREIDTDVLLHGW